MSAVPVFLPDIWIPRSAPEQSSPSARTVGIREEAHVRRSTVPSNWQLTDRGIAVVMLVAAIIMTVALAVIGLTVVRVTSADYDPSLSQESRQAHP